MEDLNTPEYQNCPYCDEEIKYGALKCKHCQTLLENVIEEDRNDDVYVNSPDKSYMEDKKNSGQKEKEVTKHGGTGMLIVGVLLLILGALGLIMGSMMFGDIGISAMIGALTAILSGIGFLIATRKIK